MEESQRKRGQHHQCERHNGSGGRKNGAHSSSESGNPRKKRSWRLRIAPRLRVLRLSSAKKVLVRLRDAYVKMMVRLAQSSLARGRGLSYGGNGCRRVTGKGRPGLKEYDENVLTQIYMSLMVQGQVTGALGSVVGS